MYSKIKEICVLVLFCFLLSACSQESDQSGYHAAPENVDDGTVLPQTEALPDTKQKQAAEGGDNVLEIGEKMFLTQINDIYNNFELYQDKTIIVEGMYALFYAPDGAVESPGVYRRGPGCCGNDGWGGFMLRYDGELPAENDWIRVTGTPELVKDGYYANLYLNVSSLEIKEERGAEFVAQ